MYTTYLLDLMHHKIYSKYRTVKKFGELVPETCLAEKKLAD